MRKIILALSVCALIPAVTIAVARADDDEDIEFIDSESEESEEEYADDDSEITEERVVAKRVTCDDIKKEMDELSADPELGAIGRAKLESLKSDYRSRCTKSAGSRATGRTKASSTRKPVAKKIDAELEVVDEPKGEETAKKDVPTSCENPDKNGCCPGEEYTDLGDAGFNCCTKDKEHCYPPMAAKKAAPKLCDDGTEPNDDGCCADEKYTDLGDLGFNCCLADGVTCFPPLK